MNKKAMKNNKKRKLDSSDEGEPATKKSKTIAVKDAAAKKKAKAKPKANSKANAKPMTRHEWLHHAKEEVGTIGEIEFIAKPKKMSKSVGYNVSKHAVIKLNADKKVAVMISMNFTCSGSKQWNEGKPVQGEKKEPAAKAKRVTNGKGDVLTKSGFMALAKPLKCKVFDQEFTVKPKQAKSGNLGWGANGEKFEKEVNGVKLAFVAGINVTVKKSKSWEEGEAESDDEKEKKDDEEEEEEEDEDEDDDVAK